MSQQSLTETSEINGSTIMHPDGDRSFPQFKGFAPEIRLQIWEHALPNARTLKVRVDPYNDTLPEQIGSFSAVPTIFHVNSESRQVALSVCREGLGATKTEWNSRFYWNPRIDTVYFPPSASWTNGVLERFLFKGDIPSSWSNDGLVPVTRHVAFPLNAWLAKGIYLEPLKDCWFLDWIHKFPLLESVTLLLEPFNQWLGEPDTSIVYYEPHDVPVQQMLDDKPSKIAQQVEAALEKYRIANDPDWEPPLVEVLIIGMRKFRPSAGCMPPRTNLDREDITGLYEIRESREERNAKKLRHLWPAEIHAVNQWSLMGQPEG